MSEGRGREGERGEREKGVCDLAATIFLLVWSRLPFLLA
jgi:hypothetical protein